MQAKISYFFITITVLLTGLASRRFSVAGSFIHDYLGDALWAAMIYCGMRCLFTRMSRQNTAIAALSFCFFIELTQLNQSEWLNTLRHSTLGGLVLGAGFLWSDVLMYTIGVGFAYFFDDFVGKGRK